MGAKLVHQSRDHHGCIEQRAHSANVAGDARASCLAFGADELPDVHRGTRGAMMDENALFANERRLFIDPAKRDPVGCSFDLKFTSGSQVEPFPESLRHDQPSCGVNGNDHAAMVFYLPETVNSLILSRSTRKHGGEVPADRTALEAPNC